MRTLQLVVLIVSVFGYVASTTLDLEMLRKIHQYKMAFHTCDNNLNYGCRCSVDSIDSLTCDFKCISIDERCNGYVDCPLGDDEVDCEEACIKGSICCEDGSCASLCDGKPECPNGADELYCEPPVPSTCEGKMQCPDGNCATVCDRDIECSDEEDCDLDERDCLFACPFNSYVCDDDGTCASRCNDNQECGNGSDESKCYLECNDDQISCRVEPNNLCRDLCDSSGEACEGGSWVTADQYCGTCFDCGTDCIKDTEGCP